MLRTDIDNVHRVLHCTTAAGRIVACPHWTVYFSQQIHISLLSAPCHFRMHLFSSDYDLIHVLCVTNFDFSLEWFF